MSSGGVVAAMRGSDDEDLGATDWELADMMARARIDVPLQEVSGRTSRATGCNVLQQGTVVPRADQRQRAGAAQYDAL